MSKICPECKIECEDNAKFCGNCGNVFEDNSKNNTEEKIKCNKCGHLNEEGVFFCFKCGNDLTENSSVYNYNNVYNSVSYEKQNNPLELQFTKESKNTAQNIIIAFLVVSIIFAVLFLIGGFKVASEYRFDEDMQNMAIFLGIILAGSMGFFGYFVYLLFMILKDLHTQNNIIISLLSKKK